MTGRYTQHSKVMTIANRSPIDSGNTETAKAKCIEHIKNLLRSHGCLLTRLWIAYSNLTIDELQEITEQQR